MNGKKIILVTICAFLALVVILYFSISGNRKTVEPETSKVSGFQAPRVHKRPVFPVEKSKDPTDVASDPLLSAAFSEALDALIRNRLDEIGITAFDEQGIAKTRFKGIDLKIRKYKTDYAFWLEGSKNNSFNFLADRLQKEFGVPTYQHDGVQGWRIYDKKNQIAEIELLQSDNGPVFAAWGIPFIFHDG